MVDKVISGTAFIEKMKRYAEKKLVEEKGKVKVKRKATYRRPRL